MNHLYPFQFTPTYREYLWGGRRLETVLGKSLGDGSAYAESWEIVDRGDDQSVVANGPLAGTCLSELVTEHGQALFGRHYPQPAFPLLFKFLDCNRNLSVQVHPNDQQASQLNPPDLGKTEAWLVLHADPGSLVYAGLKPGVDRTTLEQAISTGTTEACLHRFEPSVGDCIFVPAGVVHALGAGLVVAEIQQASDTTYRLFDWNRVDQDGKPRELHVQEALEVIDFDAGPISPQKSPVRDAPTSERLVSCDKFLLDRHLVSTPITIGGDDRFHIVAVLDGTLEVVGPSTGQSICKGTTLLIPADSDGVVMRPSQKTCLIQMYLP